MLRSSSPDLAISVTYQARVPASWQSVELGRPAFPMTALSSGSGGSSPTIRRDSLLIACVGSPPPGFKHVCGTYFLFSRSRVLGRSGTALSPATEQRGAEVSGLARAMKTAPLPGVGEPVDATPAFRLHAPIDRLLIFSQMAVALRKAAGRLIEPLFGGSR
jgi:hypothetical protein